MDGLLYSVFLHMLINACPINYFSSCLTKHFHANQGHVKFSQPVGSAAAKCTTAEYRREDRQNIPCIHSDDRMTATAYCKLCLVLLLTEEVN